MYLVLVDISAFITPHESRGFVLHEVLVGVPEDIAEPLDHDLVSVSTKS